MASKSRPQIEFGDFQTPPDLAAEVCSLIVRTGFQPATVIEPSCGRGSFVAAAVAVFPTASTILGFEVNPTYAESARQHIPLNGAGPAVSIHTSDFFHTDWARFMSALPDPMLVVGNPPWVTNAALGVLGSDNLPVKTNRANLRGIDALTGKSNFDISEWMLRQNLTWLSGREGMLAVLCKTAVARKVLEYAWSARLPIAEAALYRIDAMQHFGAAVDACLLVVHTHPGASSQSCRDFPSLTAAIPTGTFGLRDGQMVAEVDGYERWMELAASDPQGWRSGIKHDCSKVFELAKDGDQYRNGLGERVSLEPGMVFPLLKSSDLAHDRAAAPRRWLVVPQRSVGEDTRSLPLVAPLTWQYLTDHTSLLEHRGSSIYRGRPRFSIFGVGPYTFTPWKVAISGLYKRLRFVEVGPHEGQPVVLDDTCYIYPCGSAEECREVAALLRSQPAQEFFSARIFWDAKRPITARLLNQLDLGILAQYLGRERVTTHSGQYSPAGNDEHVEQLRFLRER